VDEQERRESRVKKALRALEKVKPHASLSKVQQLAGLLAALISIGGFVFSYVYATKHSLPTKGDVVAVVQEQRSEKPLPGATIEVLTMENAIVTTLSPKEQGRVTQTLKEGHYRFRVMHPRFGTETRQVYVIAGQTSEIRFRLVPRPTAATSNSTMDSINDSLRKIFR
jgi:carboxypeptidase family protein